MKSQGHKGTCAAATTACAANCTTQCRWAGACSSKRRGLVATACFPLPLATPTIAPCYTCAGFCSLRATAVARTCAAAAAERASCRAGSQGETPLIVAAIHSHWDAVERLLEEKSLVVDAKDKVCMLHPLRPRAARPFISFRASYTRLLRVPFVAHSLPTE